MIIGTWLSITDVAKEFSLEKLASNPEALRDELKSLMRSLHPDKNGGVFKSDEEKAQFLRIKEAVEFLDGHTQTGSAMIPVSQLPAVISALSQALIVRSSSDLNTLQSQYLTNTRENISRRFILPKISSGVFAAIAGFLVTYSDKFEKHPVIGPFLNDRNAQIGLLILMGYSGLFFLLTWYKERRAESQADYLLSESVLRNLFAEILHTAKKSSDAQKVSSRQILEEIQNIVGYQHHATLFASTLLSSGIDLPTIEKAAAIQTQRLIERKLLTRIDVASVDAWYEIHSPT